MRAGLLTVIMLLGMTAPSRAQCPPAFTSWPTLEEVELTLADLAAVHPSAAQLHEIGESEGGNSILALRIAFAPTAGEPPRGDVVFVGLHHGREWISAQPPLALAQCLLEATTDSDLARSLAALVVWVIPVLNPDGYARSRNAAPDHADQEWRKNLSTMNGTVYGVDLNRNFAYQWGKGNDKIDLNEGSPDEYQETYWGPSAFSERETVALRNLVESMSDPRALVTYHSYGQLVLRPWVYALTAAPGEAILEQLSTDMRTGIKGEVGATFGDYTSRLAFGEATDYFWARLRLAGLTVELRPGAFNAYSWRPPADQVDASNLEQMEAAKGLLRSAASPRLIVRDHASDSAGEPSVQWGDSGWSHPFWESPDITVDETNSRVCVRVTNVSADAMAGCTLTLYAIPPAAGMEFPPPPDLATPLGTATLKIDAGGVASHCFSWPAGAGEMTGPTARVIGVIASHLDDRPLTTLVERTSNIACRSVASLELAPGEHTLSLEIANPLFVEAALDLRWDGVPDNWTLDPKASGAADSAATLLAGVTEPVIPAEGAFTQELRLVIPAGSAPGVEHAIRIHIGLRPLTGSTRPCGAGRTFLVRVAPSS